MKYIAFILLLISAFAYGQQSPVLKTDTIEYIARRVGYFHATLTISKDSVYTYSEWNHTGQKLKDTGKLVLKEDKLFLNSIKKTRRYTKGEKSDEFYKFQMKEIKFNADKIIILPCDTIFSEYCTFYRKQ